MIGAEGVGVSETVSDIVTAARLCASEYPYRILSAARTEELCRFLRAHGIDPNRTASVQYDVIDSPLLRLTVYCDDGPDDVHTIDSHGLANHIRTFEPDLCTRQIETAVREPLPEWWRPVVSA